jgi:hypothetical protein
VAVAAVAVAAVPAVATAVTSPVTTAVTRLDHGGEEQRRQHGRGSLDQVTHGLSFAA